MVFFTNEMGIDRPDCLLTIKSSRDTEAVKTLSQDVGRDERPLDKAAAAAPALPRCLPMVWEEEAEPMTSLRSRFTSK